MKRRIPLVNDSFTKQKNKFIELKIKLTTKENTEKEENSFIKSLEKEYLPENKYNNKENVLTQILIEKVNKLRNSYILDNKPFKKEEFSFLDESFQSVQLLENDLKNEKLINFNSVGKIPQEKEALKIKRVKKVSIRLKEEYSFVNLALEVKIDKIKFNDLKLKGVKKIAEASFSDVYLHDNNIYKIIPLDVEEKPNLEDFIKETFIHQCINEEEGVCKLIKVFLAKGNYPHDLLKAWNNFYNLKGSDNFNPINYTKNQTFGVFVLEECGQDLEKYTFQNKEEVLSIIKQIFEIISNLEKKYEFEHRDLHWGNILIKNSQVKIIDFSLARITKNKVVFIDLKNKEWLFNGDEKVDEQFSIYKKMKILNNNDWLIHTPRNNVLWLVYLINKIILLTNNKIRVNTLLTKIKSSIRNCKSAEEAFENVKNIL